MARFRSNQDVEYTPDSDEEAILDSEMSELVSESDGEDSTVPTQDPDPPKKRRCPATISTRAPATNERDRTPPRQLLGVLREYATRRYPGFTGLGAAAQKYVVHTLVVMLAVLLYPQSVWSAGDAVELPDFRHAVGLPGRRTSDYEDMDMIAMNFAGKPVRDVISNAPPKKKKNAPPKENDDDDDDDDDPPMPVFFTIRDIIVFLCDVVKATDEKAENSLKKHCGEIWMYLYLFVTSGGDAFLLDGASSDSDHHRPPPTADGRRRPPTPADHHSPLTTTTDNNR